MESRSEPYLPPDVGMGIPTSGGLAGVQVTTPSPSPLRCAPPVLQGFRLVESADTMPPIASIQSLEVVAYSPGDAAGLPRASEDFSGLRWRTLPICENVSLHLAGQRMTRRAAERFSSGASAPAIPESRVPSPSCPTRSPPS